MSGIHINTDFDNVLRTMNICLIFFQDDGNGEPQKLGFLRQAISNLLLTFLSEPTDDRIKTAATLLKVLLCFVKIQSDVVSVVAFAK